MPRTDLPGWDEEGNTVGSCDYEMGERRRDSVGEEPWAYLGVRRAPSNRWQEILQPPQVATWDVPLAVVRRDLTVRICRDGYFLPLALSYLSPLPGGIRVMIRPENTAAAMHCTTSSIYETHDLPRLHRRCLCCMDVPCEQAGSREDPLAEATKDASRASQAERNENPRCSLKHRAGRSGYGMIKGISPVPRSPRPWHYLKAKSGS